MVILAYYKVKWEYYNIAILPLTEVELYEKTIF